MASTRLGCGPRAWAQPTKCNNRVGNAGSSIGITVLCWSGKAGTCWINHSERSRWRWIQPFSESVKRACCGNMTWSIRGTRSVVAACVPFRHRCREEQDIQDTRGHRMDRIVCSGIRRSSSGLTMPRLPFNLVSQGYKYASRVDYKTSVRFCDSRQSNYEKT